MDKLTFAELVARHKSLRRKKPNDEEHRIQCTCVRWFSLQYKELKGRLFAVPNGGKRDQITAEKLLAEGVISGVSDLVLLKRNAKYGALLIEMKTPKGTQSPSQKRWHKLVCADGEYKYVICRSLEDFKREVIEYLENI